MFRCVTAAVRQFGRARRCFLNPRSRNSASKRPDGRLLAVHPFLFFSDPRLGIRLQGLPLDSPMDVHRSPLLPCTKGCQVGV